MVLGERGHHLGVAADESGVDAGILKELSDQLVEHTSVGLRSGALDVHLLQNALEELVGLSGVELVTRRELLATGFLERGHHFDTAPWGLPVNVVGLSGHCGESGLVSTSDVLDKVGNEVLSQVHQIVNIGVSLVELASGELGVVSQINSLVSHLLADFVD